MTIQKKNRENTKLCHLDTDSFIAQLEWVNFYADFAGNVKT